MSCGYHRDLIAQDYRLASGDSVELASFALKPFDTRSACVAVATVESGTDIALSRCRWSGAPYALLCRRGGYELRQITASSSERVDAAEEAQLLDLFRRQLDRLHPTGIYEAKLRRSEISSPRQTYFVDIGLMPLAEEQNGVVLQRLVETAFAALLPTGSRQLGRIEVARRYRAVFWLLAARLLHDKGVEGFKRIDLGNPTEVFQRVARHYSEETPLPPAASVKPTALQRAASVFAEGPNLGSVSTESLAYLYENSLIDKVSSKNPRQSGSIRKQLGIHSTPPFLVDYILARVWDHVGAIPRDDRRILEPGCGHGAFLVAALRLLRDFPPMEKGVERHRFLRDRLVGIEIDVFAQEIAKLSLTLADIPYGNSWKIVRGDMYEEGRLEQMSSQATILLSNPPYENFSPAERRRYGEDLGANKAAETILRTVPNLPKGALFAFVVPARLLDSPVGKSARDALHRESELLEIDVFQDALFGKADSEAAVIIGRCGALRRDYPVLSRRVLNRDLPRFINGGRVSSESTASAHWLRSRNTLNIPILGELWSTLQALPTLGDLGTAKQGLSLRKDLQAKIEQRSGTPCPPDASPLILGRIRNVDIAQQPLTAWVYPSEIRTTRRVRSSEHARVIVNATPQTRGAWRIKAYLTPGHLVTNKYHVIEIPSIPPLATWALLNSPLANAFIQCHSLKRHIHQRELLRLPMPSTRAGQYASLVEAASEYRSLALDCLGGCDMYDELRARLLRMDAAALAMYHLPARLEHQLLEHFQDERRVGVGVQFWGYLPEKMTFAAPLREIISFEFQSSTMGRLRSISGNLPPGIAEALGVARRVLDEEGGGR